MNTEKNNTAISAYLREISQTPLLSPRQEIDLARKIRNGDKRARDLMISANLRLVVTVAHDYVDFGLPLLDLISEGNIGLVKAVERFDETKGAKLSTYAVWWIRQRIKRALSNHGKLVRLPVHLGEKMSRMRRVALRMSEELGREPTDDELSAEIGLGTEKIAELRSIGIRPASLDAPISDDGSSEYGESVADEDAQSPFELLRDKDLRSKVDGLLEELDSREKQIIADRFGFGGGERKTLREVGDTLGVSRERIRQLENSALAKLRRALSLKEEPVGRLAAA
jgi:RNA polymerase primary sigma factor